MKKLALCLLLVICTFVCSCGVTEKYSREDFFTMSTYATLVTNGGTDELSEGVKDVLLDIERKFSFTNDTSLISRYNNGDKNALDEECNYVLHTAHKVSVDTNGTFDYTLGALKRLWNIGTESERVPQKHEIDEALLSCGYDREDSADVLYDLGAIVKGYAGDKAAQLLAENLISDFMLSIGGNVTVSGSSEKNKAKGVYGWTVGITNPFDKQNILGTITLQDATVSVSGDYERFFEHDGKVYHHIFDSRTGYPAESDIRSVAVVCDNGIYADALSTALFVMGKDEALDFYKSGIYPFEAVICTNDGKVYVTDRMKDNFVPYDGAKYEDGKALLYIK